MFKVLGYNEMGLYLQEMDHFLFLKVGVTSRAESFHSQWNSESCVLDQELIYLQILSINIQVFCQVWLPKWGLMCFSSLRITLMLTADK